jgi:hypothetical protein
VRTCLSGCFLAPLLLKVTHQLLIASPVLRRPHLKLRWCLAKATRRWLRMPLCRAMLKGRSRWSMAHLPRRSRVRPTTLPQLSRGMRVVASWRMLIGWPPQVAVPHLRHPMMDGSWITIQAPPPQPTRCPMSADLIGHCSTVLTRTTSWWFVPTPLATSIATRRATMLGPTGTPNPLTRSGHRRGSSILLQWQCCNPIWGRWLWAVLLRGSLCQRDSRGFLFRVGRRLPLGTVLLLPPVARQGPPRKPPS